MMKKIMLVLIFGLTNLVNAGVVIVQTTPTMVAYPEPAAGLQFYVQTPGVYYYYTGTNYTQYVNNGSSVNVANPAPSATSTPLIVDVVPSPTPVVHWVSLNIGATTTPTPVQVIPSPGPGVTVNIVACEPVNHSSTDSSFHLGNGANTITGTNSIDYPGLVGANLPISSHVPFYQATPNAPVSIYLDSGIGPITGPLGYTRSDGQ